VLGLRRGHVLLARDERLHLHPASTLKLATTAAALDALGPDYRFRTALATSARLDAFGRLLGDVYLVGGGDPDLSGRFFDGDALAPFTRLAAALEAAGVRRIEGRLIGQEGLFTGERRGDGWAWDDLDWWYGAEVSALSFNDNAVDLRVAPGEREGDPLRLEWTPVSSYYEVRSLATTGVAGAESTLRVETDAATNVIHVSGALALDAEPRTLYPALRDPARYAATVFAEVLARRGILVSGGVATTSAPLPPTARTLAVHEGPTLADAIAVVNKQSQNLHAEMLLRLVGWKASGAGDVEAGLAAVGTFLTRLGVAHEGWARHDGSGLSRLNLVDAHGLLQLLVAMDRHPHAAAFRDSLAVAGVDGTLEKRMRGTPAEGRIRAKTGTLRGVSGLAGYAERADGDRLAFVFLINHHTQPGKDAVAALDGLAEALLQ